MCPPPAAADNAAIPGPREPDQASTPAPGGEPERDVRRLTRAGATWVAVSAALVLLVLLIVFMLQNPTRVDIDYFGMAASIPLGMAMLIAAVAGGILVAIAGAARILQLRRAARRKEQPLSQQPPTA